MTDKVTVECSTRKIETLDEELSNRFIQLDPAGYFLIKIDSKSKEIIVEHFTNNLDKKGRAIDPDTGKPILCSGGDQRKPQKIFRGRSAKEVGIQLTEGDSLRCISRLDHALYLGRELQKAEDCLKHKKTYIQD